MVKGFAPATERNRKPILDVLRRVLPGNGLVLEVASGTGQHAVFFSGHLPGLRWQPSDATVDALRSIEAWVEESALENLLPPIELDVRSPRWPIASADALLCINMIHISPWETTESLFRGASALLAGGSPLITYGPYRLHGEHSAPSNAAFDESLRSRNPRWGVRDIDALIELAGRTGFELQERVPMPANNMTLVWTRVP
ncbi:MAG: class I SAM-dependent methyltransferase [Myxococcales bacterium]|nr:class I SAM-dependent methyltransferase [Myxococcales bacterium]